MKWWQWALLALGGLLVYGAWNNSKIQGITFGEALVDLARRWTELPGDLITKLNRGPS